MKHKYSYIYGLVDPRTNKIRYIGKSVNPYKRFSAHLQKNCLKSRTHKNIWIKSLIKLNLLPELKIIKKVLSVNIDFWEKKYIKFYKKKYKLVNGTDGGDGWSLGKPANSSMKNNLKKLAKKQQKKIIARRLKDGKELTFNSSKGASNCLKIHKSLISEALTGSLDYIRGWHFRLYDCKFKNTELTGEKRMNRKSLKATCISTGKKIEFNSRYAAKCAGFFSKGIEDCLKGIREHSQGYRWENAKKT